MAPVASVQQHLLSATAEGVVAVGGMLSCGSMPPTSALPCPALLLRVGLEVERRARGPREELRALGAICLATAAVALRRQRVQVVALAVEVVGLVPQVAMVAPPSGVTAVTQVDLPAVIHPERIAVPVGAVVELPPAPLELVGPPGWVEQAAVALKTPEALPPLVEAAFAAAARVGPVVA